jgi:hypothetical protein
LFLSLLFPTSPSLSGLLKPRDTFLVERGGSEFGSSSCVFCAHLVNERARLVMFGIRAGDYHRSAFKVCYPLLDRHELGTDPAQLVAEFIQVALEVLSSLVHVLHARFTRA